MNQKNEKINYKEFNVILQEGDENVKQMEHLHQQKNYLKFLKQM